MRCGMASRPFERGCDRVDSTGRTARVQKCALVGAWDSRSIGARCASTSTLRAARHVKADVRRDRVQPTTSAAHGLRRSGHRCARLEARFLELRPQLRKPDMGCQYPTSSRRSGSNREPDPRRSACWIETTDDTRRLSARASTPASFSQDEVDHGKRQLLVTPLRRTTIPGAQSVIEGRVACAPGTRDRVGLCQPPLLAEPAAANIRRNVSRRLRKVDVRGCNWPLRLACATPPAEPVRRQTNRR
jgi:hypothetical protein